MTARDFAIIFAPILTRRECADNEVVTTRLIEEWEKIAKDVNWDKIIEADGTDSDTEDDPLVDLLASVGLMKRKELLLNFDISVDKLKTMIVDDLMEIGIPIEESLLLINTARRAGKKLPEHNGKGLDPRVLEFLETMGLSKFQGLFEDFEIDWIILDMSATSDFQELGLDDETVVKIMKGLGKEAAKLEKLENKPIKLKDGEVELRGALDESAVKLDPKWLVDLREVRVQKKIGIGGYAEVWKATYKNKTVAFKLLQEDTMDDQRVVDEFKREMAVMSVLEHPNIVAFFGSVEQGNSLAMILEYAGKGDLEHILLDRETPIPYLQRLRWAKQVAQGLQYLHTRNPRIIHRDIKSANILVDELLCTKICDFGLAKRKVVAELPNKAEQISQLAVGRLNVRSAAVQFTTLVGTPAWTAPELIANRSYTEKVDVYSYGVFLWELMCRQTPHEGKPHFELAYDILSHDLRPGVPVWMPETFSQLMQSCWAKKPEPRPSMDVVLKVLAVMLSQPKHDQVALPY